MTSAVARATTSDHTLWESPRVLRVAVAGCGVVGGALLEQLEAEQRTLLQRRNLRVEIVAVLVRDLNKQRATRVRAPLLTNDLNAFLARDADVYVEAIGGDEPAGYIAESVLAAGRSLVTANKALIAARGTRLTALARQYGGTLRYDAAVGGGVPVLRMLNDAIGTAAPVRVRGILNGTTNFILSQIEAGVDFDEALRKARTAGFAETDASRDLDGRDAADKLALIAWNAFGVAPEQFRLDRQSFLPDPQRYVRLGSRIGRTVRQIAECSAVDGGVSASVTPVLLARDCAFARTVNEDNRFEVETGWRSPLCTSGPGAGGAPTASALLGDLLVGGALPQQSIPGAVSVADMRTSEWLVEVRGGPSSLHRASPTRSIVNTDTSAEFSWVTIRSATRAEVSNLLSTLASDGLDPIAAVLEPSKRHGRAE